MKKILAAAFFTLGILSFAEQCEAHVLVYRFRLVSSVSESAKGTSSSSSPSTLCSLFILDLDTDYVAEINDKPDRLWLSPRIQLNEKPKSGKNAAEYSFRFDDDRDSNSLSGQRLTKFEFYGKNDSKFYCFHHDFDDYAQSGVDHGSAIVNGLCTLKVDIGGGRISSVPNDFVVTQKRGDNKEFKTNVFSMKYDSTITKAVNTYLSTKKIQSTKGSHVSTSIPAATSWLINTYLPPKYPAAFPKN